MSVSNYAHIGWIGAIGFLALAAAMSDEADGPAAAALLGALLGPSVLWFVESVS